MRVELSRNRKTATLISEGLVSPLWVHTRWIRDAFWTKLSRLFRYFWRAESSAASVLSPSLHQHLAATAPAFIGRWRGRKWHHPTWSYTSVAVRFGAPHSDDEGCVYSYVLLFQGLSILFYLILFYSTLKFYIFASMSLISSCHFECRGTVWCLFVSIILCPCTEQSCFIRPVFADHVY